MERPDRPAPNDPPEPPHVRSIRQRTLTALRWLAIAGQTAAVLVAEFAVGVDLPLFACAVCILVSVGVNVCARIWPSQSRRLSERDAMLTLMFDLGQLAALLYLTGGLSNPFSVFLLAPVTIAATVLTLRTTLLLGAFSIAATTVLSFQYLPLRLEDGELLAAPPLLLLGFWLAILLGVAFQAVYSRRVSTEAFEMSAALTATQMALEREQRLASIGALAAAAAHELGTPLATIKLVARELRGELDGQDALAEDADLILEQAARCRDILERLSNARAPEDEQIKTAPITTVIEEAAAPHRYRRVSVALRLAGEPVDADAPATAQPIILRSPEIVHGLRNLVQNAVDFAASQVWIDIETDGPEITVRISDDGAGFRPDILQKLGEPFATSRERSADDIEERSHERYADGYEGMGLGVFISKTLLERTGATLSFRNAAPDLREGLGREGLSRLAARPRERARPSGAVAVVSWPRELLITSETSAAEPNVKEDASGQAQSVI